MIQLFHATNLAKFEGDYFKLGNAVIEDFPANHPNHKGPYVFAAQDQEHLKGMVFKTKLSLAHSHTVSADKYPWWTLVENLEEYLASVEHVGRIIKLPADAVAKYGFKQVEKPAPDKPTSSGGLISVRDLKSADPNRLIDKWVSPRGDIPLKECDLEYGKTTLKEQMQNGLQIFYLKRETGKDFLDRRPKQGIGDEFLEKCLAEEDGSLGLASIQEVAEIRERLGKEF